MPESASAGIDRALFQYSSKVAESCWAIGPAANTSSSANWDVRVDLKVLITDIAPAYERYCIVHDEQFIVHPVVEPGGIEHEFDGSKQRWYGRDTRMD